MDRLRYCSLGLKFSLLYLELPIFSSLNLHLGVSLAMDLGLSSRFTSNSVCLKNATGRAAYKKKIIISILVSWDLQDQEAKRFKAQDFCSSASVADEFFFFVLSSLQN